MRKRRRSTSARLRELGQLDEILWNKWPSAPVEGPLNMENMWRSVMLPAGLGPIVDLFDSRLDPRESMHDELYFMGRPGSC